MNIYEYDNYKAFLHAMIGLESSERGFQNRLAKYAKCQTSHLSQVLNKDKNLSIDQACDLISKIETDEDKIDYFVCLVQKARAGTVESRSFFEKKAENLKRRHQVLSERLKSCSTESSLKTNSKYYSHWSYVAIHIASYLHGNNTIETLSEFLNLKLEDTLKVLNDLESMKLMVQKNGKWESTKNNVNIKDDDLSIRNHHLNWRLKVLNELPLKYSSMRDLHYTGIFALSSSDKFKMKDELNSVIVKFRKMALNTEKPEVCFNLNVDFSEV